MRRDLDRIVDAVARKVELQVLQELRETPCSATKDECTGEGLCAVRRPRDVERLRAEGASRVGASLGIGSVRNDLAALIDHTLLTPDASYDDLKALCDEAKRHGFAAVCVNGVNVRMCKDRLRNSSVRTVAVVGFPLGAMSPEAKAFEAKQAVADGADEIDMVINLGALKSGGHAVVEQDIHRVVEAVRPVPVKVIIESGALERDEKVTACSLAKAAGAAYVKTSTGFGPGGATLEDVRLMRSVVGNDLGVKASGGVRTASQVDELVDAGATRVGASASVAIVTGEQAIDSRSRT